jgi:hypothetical protein
MAKAKKLECKFKLKDILRLLGDEHTRYRVIATEAPKKARVYGKVLIQRVGETDAIGWYDEDLFTLVKRPAARNLPAWW